MSFGEFIKTTNTVGLWHFNGNANDESGNGLNGANIGTVVYSKANGKFNEGAGSFLTNSSVIRVEDNNLLDLTTFTISVWFKVNSVWDGVMIAKFRSASATDINYYIDTARGDNRVRILLSPNGTFTEITIPKRLVNNTWYNVIITAGSGSLKAYINSKLEYSTIYTGAIPTNSHPLVIGGRLSKNGVAYDSYLDGCIDEVFIENRIWTAQEIQKYYTNALGRF